MKRGRRKVSGSNLIHPPCEIIDKPASRRTRSQSLKEVEILQAQEKSHNVLDLPPRNGLNREFYREGSHDSAISSDSSKWSISSRVSLISLTSCASTKSTSKKKVTTIDGEDDGSEVQRQITNDRITWLSRVSQAQIKSAVPAVRSGLTNGHVIRQSASCSKEVSGTNTNHGTNLSNSLVPNKLICELLIHFCIFISTASMMSIELYSKQLLLQQNTRHSKNPFLLQTVVYLVTGITFDMMSPVVALFISPVMTMGVCLFLFVNMSQYMFPYLTFFNAGLLGSQLLGTRCQQICRLETLLPRIGLSYGLSLFFCYEVIEATSNYFGAPTCCLLFAIASLLSISAILKLTSKGSKVCALSSLSEDKGLLHFLGLCVLKLFLTIPTTLLQGILQETIKHGSFLGKNNLAAGVSIGFLATEALVIPLLLISTSPASVICIVAACNTVIYPALLFLFDGINVQLLVAAVPLCGIVGVTQAMLLYTFIKSFSRLKGIVLATNLITHLLARFLALQIQHYLTGVCMFGGKSHLISLDLYHWVGQFVQFKTFDIVPNVHLKALSCDNIHFESLALTGCVCSFIFLVFGLFLRKHL